MHKYDTWPPFSREHDRNPLPFRVSLVLSMFFWISQPRVFGRKTEHESFFQVANFVYAAGESARNNKKKSPLQYNTRILRGIHNVVLWYQYLHGLFSLRREALLSTERGASVAVDISARASREFGTSFQGIHR